MREWVPYERPRGSIHSLETLSGLSSDRCRILCVSDRTLYILLNYAASDIDYQARFASELHARGYIPVDEDSLHYGLWRDVVNQFKIEVEDMSCDVQAGLEAIAEALRYSGGGGCSTVGSPTFNCIVDLDNDQLLGPPDASQGDKGIDPPPEGFATWDEYFAYKCQAAHFIWEFQRKNMVMIRNFEGVALVSSIVAPVAAGLAGVLPAVFTPAGFVVFVASIVAIGALAAASWFYIDEMIDEWDANKEAIVCALYNAGTSVQAVSALANALEDAIQAIVTWGVLGPVSGEISALLSTAFSQLAGNGMVEPLFKSIAAVTSITGTVDCDTCEGETTLVRTADSSPYNVVEVGTLGEDGEEDTSTQGWRSCNSLSQLTIEFTTPAYTITEWSLSYHVGFGGDHDLRTPQTYIEVWDGDSWESFWLHQWAAVYADEDTLLSITVDDTSFAPSTLYRLRPYVFEYLNCLWSREHLLGPVEP